MTHLFHLWQTLDTEYGPRERVSFCISSLRFVLVRILLLLDAQSAPQTSTGPFHLSEHFCDASELHPFSRSNANAKVELSASLSPFPFQRNTRDPRLHLLFDYDESNVEGWRLKSTKMHTDLDSTIHSPRFRGIRRREHV